MSKYSQHGNTIQIADKNSLIIHDSLPVATYTVGFNPMAEAYYLIMVDAVSIPEKRYGDSDKRCARILNTYTDRPGNTGVLLSGEKGSGKTLLAKTLSVEGAKQGLPTIIINAPYAGDKFNKFMQDIDTPCIVLMDEFEKTYEDRKSQNATLTLLDGVYSTKKLFILTVNDKWGVGEYFHNRPGRLFYQFEYKGLDADFIKEYCQDNLKNKEHIETVVKTAMIFETFNFDMLKALVEDMNRYNESPQEALKWLNIKPTANARQAFNVSVTVDGKEVKAHDLDSWERGAPVLQNRIGGYYYTNEEDDSGTYFNLTNKDLKTVDPHKGVFVYEHNKLKVTFTRDKPQEFSYSSYIA